MKKVFFLHILPIIITITVFFTVILNKELPAINQAQAISFNPAASTFFANYDNGTEAERIVINSFSKGSVTLMGSSELANKDFPFIPYNFLRCICVGHAGNQTFSIFTQLCSMSYEVKKTRLVIILSPGWFSNGYNKGTSLESFLEFNNERFLYRTYFNPTLPDSFKSYIANYISHKLPEIVSPSAIIKAYNYSLANKNLGEKLVYYPFSKLYNKYCSFKGDKVGYLKFPPVPEQFAKLQNKYEDSTLNHIAGINWDSLYALAAKYFKAHSTNNDMYINNDYYTKFIKTHHLSHQSIVPLNENQEFKDFKMLLSLLRYYHYDTYFIIPPLNPYAYDNLKDLEPTVKAVTEELDKNNFPYTNFYVTDTTHYQKGMLNDVMHLGNLGWCRVDSIIFTYFYKNKPAKPL
jgi:D-alanine transfer protein